jgi:putative Mg2+ transporter-C (MgtC) family protein
VELLPLAGGDVTELLRVDAGDQGLVHPFACNIAAALAMGSLIGVERQFRQHPAGLRTNALVALGAALFVALSRLMDDQNSPTRIASYIVSGLGFLGGGVILREGLNVRGLATAATIWCSGAVGTLCGAGFVGHAALGTVAILFSHLCLRPAGRWIDSRVEKAVDVETLYRMRVVCPRDEAHLIRTILLRHINSHPAMRVQGFTTQDTEKVDMVAVVVDLFSAVRSERTLEELVNRINVEPRITSVSWEEVH